MNFRKAERPERPMAPRNKRGLGQIFCPCGLKVGQCYWVYTADGCRYTIILESLPFRKNGGLWVRVKDVNNSCNREMSLGDMGISPYETGLYNSTNFTVIDP